MTTQKDKLTFTMNIPRKAHKIAQQFCQKQPDTSKAKQIYLNTLAVYSVHEYLGYLGFDTDLDASDSWQPSLQYLSDVADLEIPDYGRLECRPVLPDGTSCYVPPDVWMTESEKGDPQRIGYVAVQLDSALQEATILGFLPSVQSSSVPLDDWQPLEDMIAVLSKPIPQPIFHLRQWFDGVVGQGWQMVDRTLLSHRLSPSFRQNPSLKPIVQAQVLRERQLRWQDAVDAIPLRLTLGLSPTDTAEIDIWVTLGTQDEQNYLPLDLDLIIVDEQGQSVMQAKSCGAEGIHLQFGGQPNEQFQIKVLQGKQEITERFVV